MGVLGKDLLDFHRPRTNTKVEFGASGYWVESHPTMQPYGAVLTEILNLDAAPFQELLDQYRKTVAEKDAEQAARAFQAVTNGFASLPLYRLYWNDVQLFASMDVGELFVGEAQEAFREYVMQDDTLPRFMQEQLDAMEVLLKKMDQAEDDASFAEMDIAFHGMIVDAADSPSLKRAWDNLRLVEWTSVSVAVTQESLPELAEQHWQIFRTLRSHAEQEAGAYMFLHIKHFGEELKRYVTETEQAEAVPQEREERRLS